MLYLATINVACHEYMGDTYYREATRLVEAESEKEAKTLLETLYENNSAYHSGTTYTISVESMMPVLSKANVDTFPLKL